MNLILWRAVLLIASAAIAPLGAQAVWRVDPLPLTTIGTTDLSGSELSRVSGARRLPDGRVVVANGKPLEIRVFAPGGSLLTRFGRNGSGPGEFRSRLDLLRASGESIAVYDGGNRRVLTYLPNGTLVDEKRDAAGTASLGWVRFSNFTAIRIAPRDSTACALRFAATLPRPVPVQLREMFVDDNGRLWVRPAEDSIWTVYHGTGVPHGRVSLPRSLELLQVGADFVVGKSMDSDGFEQIVVRRVAIPPASGPAPRCVMPVRDTIPVSRVRSAQIRTYIRNSLTAFEALHTRLGHYVSTADSLHVEGGEDMLTSITRAGAGGYVLVVFDKATTFMCAIGVGDGTPAGWPEEVIQCDW